MVGKRMAMIGLVVGSVGIGGLIGAVAFSPGLGLAVGTEPGGRGIEVCIGASGSFAAAADAIGIETSELLAALRDGDTISEVADTNGVEVSEVVDAIVASEQERLDRLVEDGALTREQADELATDLEERATDLVNGDLAPFPLFGRPGPIGHPGLWGIAEGPLAAAADAIDIPVSELVLSLREGRTIADVSRSNDVAVSTVVDAVVAAMQERLDAAVENGWITRERADEMAADLEEQATDLVSGDPAFFPHVGWGPRSLLPDPSWSVGGWFPHVGWNGVSEPSMF